MKLSTTKQELIIFISLTFAMSVILSLGVFLSDFNSTQLTLVRISAMFIPFLGMLIMKFGFESPVETMGWRRFPLKWVLVGLFLLPVAIHLVNLPLVALLNDMHIPWQEWLVTPTDEGLYVAPENQGWGEMNSSQLIYRIILNAGIGLLIVTILAFFEESAWRSWMLPRMLHLYNPRIAVLYSAIYWAIWHVPFVLGGLNAIPEVSLVPMLVLYPLGLAGAGIVIGWLWVRTTSIWVVCLAHGALNNWGQYAFKLMKDGPPNPDGWPWLYTGVNVTMLLTGMIILLSLEKMRNEE